MDDQTPSYLTLLQIFQLITMNLLLSNKTNQSEGSNQLSPSLTVWNTTYIQLSVTSYNLHKLQDRQTDVSCRVLNMTR